MLTQSGNLKEKLRKSSLVRKPTWGTSKASAWFNSATVKMYKSGMNVTVIIIVIKSYQGSGLGGRGLRDDLHLQIQSGSI